MVNEEEKPFLPACWSDDTRMNALFAPFRPKESNPESWNSRMAFWGDVLRSWCIHKNDATISETDARSAFMRGGRRPACLGTVVEEMLKQGTIVPPTYYISAVHSSEDGWIKWGTKKALRPVGYAVSFVASYIVKKGDEVPLSDQKFVIPTVVKHQAESLLSSFADSSDMVGTLQELMDNTSMKFPSEEAFQIVLGYLIQQKLAVRKGHLFKLGKDATSRPSQITEIEEALWRLRVAVKRLTSTASALEARGEQALKSAKVALAAGDKVAAKGHLRRKHAIVDRHTKCLDALDNVRSLAEALKQTETDAQVVDTYRSGVKALKKNMADKDISEDIAGDTMDDLKEVLDSCVEIESTISKPVDSFDADELEQELAELLASDSGNTNTSPQGGNRSTDRIALPDLATSNETRKLLMELPEVPTLSVLSRKSNLPEASEPRNEAKKSKVPVAVAAALPTDIKAGIITPKPKSDNPVPDQRRMWYPPKNDVFPRASGKPDDPGINKTTDYLTNLVDKNISMRNPILDLKNNVIIDRNLFPKVPTSKSINVIPSQPIDNVTRVQTESSIDDLERRLKGLRGLPDLDELDLPDLDSEDDEALSNSWSPTQQSK